jgi:hypothetical protein
MSEEQERRPALTAFEAALAALVPRAQGLDRERVMFLAGRAAAMAEMGLAEGVREGAESGRVRACTHKSVREDATAGVLGSAAQSTGGQTARATRPFAWVWPSAFAAMTAVAASLLVALLAQPAPQVADRVVPIQRDSGLADGGQQDRKPAVPPTEAEPVTPASEDRPRPRPPWPWDALAPARSNWQQDRLARAGLSREGTPNLPEIAADPRVRSPKVSAAADGKNIETAPATISNRELFERLLKEAGADRMQAES